MKDDFGNLRAERDEPIGYRNSPQPAPRKHNYTLQIALGIWLGGTALGITWFLASLLLAKLAMMTLVTP